MKLYIHAANDVDNLDFSERRKLAYSKKTIPSILDKLSEDKDEYVRQNVAENLNTSIETLKKLSEDSHNNVREGVGSNPNTPIEILKKLADDEDSSARRGVARNPNTPVEILEKLADDEEWIVRYDVAHYNPNTPVEILEKLADDENVDVRKAVKKNKNTPQELKDKLAVTSKKTKWQKMIDKIQSENEDGIDSLYEQTKAGMYIENLQEQVEDKLGVWLEPSIQGGQGGIWILDSDDDSTLAENIDYKGFNYDVLDAAISSKNETEFMNWYKSYLEGLIER